MKNRDKITPLRRLSAFSDKLLSLLFPRRCPGCGRLLSENDGKLLCENCSAEVLAARSVCCPRCRRAVMLCRCAPTERITVAVYSLYPYRRGANDAVGRMLVGRKDRDDRAVRAFLAAQMVPLCQCAVSEQSARLETPPTRWILAYPPRSYEKRMEAGFDQSQTLAEAISVLSGYPLVSCLERVRRGNTAQKSLGASERFENAKASYTLKASCREQIRGAGVLLIDDIVTTGATLQACADLLYGAGAVCVAAVSAARTVQG